MHFTNTRRMRSFWLLLLLLANAHHARAVTDVAHGVVPTGDSFYNVWPYGYFAYATDGSDATNWHSNAVDSCYLVLDFAEDVLISYMTISTPYNSNNYGYQSLEISTSGDGSSWSLVRTDTVTDCSRGRSITHSGLSNATRYLKIGLSDLCGGAHFAIREWRVYVQDPTIAPTPILMPAPSAVPTSAPSVVPTPTPSAVLIPAPSAVPIPAPAASPTPFSVDAQCIDCGRRLTGRTLLFGYLNCC